MTGIRNSFAYERLFRRFGGAYGTRSHRWIWKGLWEDLQAMQSAIWYCDGVLADGRIVFGQVLTNVVTNGLPLKWSGWDRRTRLCV